MFIDAMFLKNIVGNAATVFTIAVFLSGIEICRKIWLKKSTCDISALPFICGLISCSLWLRYGMLINDSALIIVNSTGAILQILYSLWYIKFTVLKGVFYKQLAIALLVISFVYGYTALCSDNESARIMSGLASCCAGVVFMGSPLAAVAHVLKTKNTETMPFYMILSTLIMATLWLFYGVLTDDWFVQIPNFLGAVLALSQICLFLLYPTKKPHYELYDKS